MTDARKPRRRWYQYSLRSLLLLMLLASIGMSWFAVRMQKSRRQQDAVEAVEKAGGWVVYDCQSEQASDPNAVPPGPGWLRDRLGEYFFANVVAVYFDTTLVTDDDLQQLKRLPQLRTLYLAGALITDAGVEHLAEITQLEVLNLSATRVTDAGLNHLKALTHLWSLGLDHADVTDAGLQHLRGLTQLQELGLNHTNVTDAGLENLKGLTQLRWLDLRWTKVTEEGVKRLQKALPNCRFYTDPAPTPTSDR